MESLYHNVFFVYKISQIYSGDEELIFIITRFTIVEDG